MGEKEGGFIQREGTIRSKRMRITSGLVGEAAAEFGRVGSQGDVRLCARHASLCKLSTYPVLLAWSCIITPRSFSFSFTVNVERRQVAWRTQE